MKTRHSVSVWPPARAEYLQELIRAGIEMHQANKNRGWLERHMGVPLLDADKLTTQDIGPLGLLEHNTLLKEYMQLSMQSQFNKREL